MKDQILEFFRDLPDSAVQQFNTAFNLYRKTDHTSAAIIRKCNSGFTERNLETLLYELKKNFGITETDIHTKKTVLSSDILSSDVLPSTFKIQELDNGKKLRNEFSFLQGENCPNEFKILIADKISAWERFKKAHAELVSRYFDKKENPELSEEEKENLLQLVKESVESFELNRDIYEELEHYQKTGKILGKHPILADKLQDQTINEMSAVDLVKRLNVLKSNINRNKRMVKEAKDPKEIKKINARIAQYEAEKKKVETRIESESK